MPLEHQTGALFLAAVVLLLLVLGVVSARIMPARTKNTNATPQKAKKAKAPGESSSGGQGAKKVAGGKEGAQGKKRRRSAPPLSEGNVSQDEDAASAQQQNGYANPTVALTRVTFPPFPAARVRRSARVHRDRVGR